MRLPITLRRRSVVAVVVALAIGSLSLAAQAVHEAPAGAPSTGRLGPDGEPGQPLTISGVLVSADGSPVSGASLYVYQTDHEGYYGVKPASDNRNPRLKLFLRSDARGTWSFSTIKPGSYPNSRVQPTFISKCRRRGARRRCSRSSSKAMHSSHRRCEAILRSRSGRLTGAR